MSQFNIYQEKEVSIYDDNYNKFNIYNQNIYNPYRPNTGRGKKRNYKNKKYSNNYYYNNTQLHLSSSTNNSISTKSSSPASISSLSYNEFITKFVKNQILPKFPYQALLNTYEGICNFIIFAKETSLYIDKNKTLELKTMSLIDFFKCFDMIATFGMEISFLNESNEISYVSYSLSLSSMIIKLTNLSKQKYEELLNKCKSKYSISNKESELSYAIDDNLKVSFINDKLIIKIEYYETKPPHNRMLIPDLMEKIQELLSIDSSIIMSNIDKSSWFCFSWIPLHATNQEFINTSFLVYYQFASELNDLCDRGYNNYYEIPLIGILPIKIDENLWLKKIRRINIGSIFQSDCYDFKMALNDSIVRYYI